MAIPRRTMLRGKCLQYLHRDGKTPYGSSIVVNMLENITVSLSFLVFLVWITGDFGMNSKLLNVYYWEERGCSVNSWRLEW